MSSLPYPLCHNCQADLVGMARMPYPSTVSSVGCISLHFLPINQSLSLIIQFNGKGYHLSLVCLERFSILLGSHLFCGSIYATVIAKLQFENINEVGGFYHHIYPTRSYHLFYFYTATYGIEYGAHNKAVALLHIHAGKLLVTLRHISYKSL